MVDLKEILLADALNLQDNLELVYSEINDRGIPSINNVAWMLQII